MQKIIAMAKRFTDINEALAYIRTLPLDAVMTIAAESLTEPEIKQLPRVTLTEEQFSAFFRIRGLNDSGEKETRGRKKKELF